MTVVFCLIKDAADVIVCKNAGKKVKKIERYQTSGKMAEYMKADEPTFGLSSTSLEWLDGFVYCSGVRSSQDAKYNLTEPGYLIVAVGPLQDTGKMRGFIGTFYLHFLSIIPFSAIQRHVMLEIPDEVQKFLAPSGEASATATATEMSSHAAETSTTTTTAAHNRSTRSNPPFLFSVLLSLFSALIFSSSQ